MILAMDELPAHPEDKAQWYMYYNTTDDLIYIQTLEQADPSYPHWEAKSTGASVRESMRIGGALTRTKYSGKDFQTYKDQIVAHVKDQWGRLFNAFMSSETSIMIIEYISAALDQMSFYLDRESDEWYLSLSRIRSNVSRIADELGYKAQSAQPSLVDLKITLPGAPYSFDVPLKRGHQIQGPNDLIFELDSDQVILAGQGTEASPKMVTAYQGETHVEVFAADGSLNPSFPLGLIPDDEFLTDYGMICSVNGTEWELDDFLPFAASEVYEVNFLSSPPLLKFGNNIVGKMPELGNEIRISYVSTRGKGGGLATEGTVNQSLTPVVVNFAQIPIAVTNDLPATPGADPEPIDQIKANAPRSWMAADRLVTKRDIEALVLNYPGVAKGNAISIRGIEDDIQLNDLIDSISASRDYIEARVAEIKSRQSAIRYMSTAGKSGCTDISNTGTQISTEADAIETAVDAMEEDLSDAKSDLDEAKNMLDYIPFQENIGYGDGVTLSFSKVLAMKPVVPNTFMMVVGSPVASKTNISSPDGDCDTNPGYVSSSGIFPTFVSGDIGKLIRVGSDYRQITRFVDVHTVEYSGPRIYGTSLIVEVMGTAIVARDDGAGAVSGNGIQYGSIDYGSSTNKASVSILFVSGMAPAGVSGKYGVPLACTYQYENAGIQTVIDEAIGSIDEAIADSGSISTNIGTIGTKLEDIDRTASTIVASLNAADAHTAATDSIANLLLTVPDSIDEDVAALKDYLDDVLSSECKANIVRISVLQMDANGFYTAPTVALMKAVKTYVDERRIETVRYSIVSGAYYMLGVSLVIRVKINKQYLFSDVKPVLESAIDEMLKGRDYYVGLMRAEYYGTVKSVDGIDYPDVNIATLDSTPAIAYVDPDNDEEPPAVDENGNLFIRDYEIITKGTIVIEEIA